MYSLQATKAGFKTAVKVVRFLSGRAEQSVSLTMEGLESALTVPVRAAWRFGDKNGVSSTGANKYTVTAQDIANLPLGENSNSDSGA